MSDTASAPNTPAQGPMADEDSPIPAATLVIFRAASNGGPPQLLMAQRGGAMRFAGGATVFPGGRVDPSDRDLARTLLGASGALEDADVDADAQNPALDDTAARIAAIRETLEETGLVIAMAQPVTAAQAAQARQLLLKHGSLAPVLTAMGWQLAPECLVPFARWCPGWKRAFDTRFYLADLGSGLVDIAADGTEFTRMFWITAAEALTLSDTGELSIIFPTRMNLERLALFDSFAEARAHALATPIKTITPRNEDRDGAPWVVIPDGLGYPVLGQPADVAKRA